MEIVVIGVILQLNDVVTDHVFLRWLKYWLNVQSGCSNRNRSEFIICARRQNYGEVLESCTSVIRSSKKRDLGSRSSGAGVVYETVSLWERTPA